MKEIRSEIEIHAAAEHVWEILMDFRSFPDWNPFIQRIEGEIRKEARLDVFIKLPGKKAMKFRPRVLVVEKAREFRWIGNLIIPGVFDGEHIFEIESMDEQKILFVQREKFTGILAFLFFRSIKDPTLQGFHEMNNALKIRAESKKD
jgi:hypothetical protein